MISGKTYKLITFDLDTNELKLVYSKGSWRNAYEDIKSFLKKNNFNYHPEGSVYISSEKLTKLQVDNIIKKANITMKWFKYGVRDMRVGNIDKPHLANVTETAIERRTDMERNKLIAETKENQRKKQQKTIEAIKAKKINNSIESKSTDKER